MLYLDKYNQDPYTRIILKTDKGDTVCTGILQDTKSIRGNASFTWNMGGANLVDAFMEGLANGSQKMTQMLNKYVQTAEAMKGGMGSKSPDESKMAKTLGMMSQAKVYSASSFYKQYGGSDITLPSDAKFTFMTISDDPTQTASNQVHNILEFLSPTLIPVIIGKTVSSVKELPPNNYRIKDGGGFDLNEKRQISTQGKQEGTFTLHIGRQAIIKPLLIQSIDVEQSVKNVILSNGRSYPLSITLSLRFTSADKKFFNNFVSGIIGE